MNQPPYQDELTEQVANKEQRKLNARHNQDRGIWYGLGMFGLVGWSIAIPTVIGIAIGIWMDRTWDHSFSCTLMCLFVGVVIGCSIAWYWVSRESMTDVDSPSTSSESADEPQDNSESLK